MQKIHYGNYTDQSYASWLSFLPSSRNYKVKVFHYLYGMKFYLGKLVVKTGNVSYFLKSTDCDSSLQMLYFNIPLSTFFIYVMFVKNYAVINGLWYYSVLLCNNILKVGTYISSLFHCLCLFLFRRIQEITTDAKNIPFLFHFYCHCIRDEKMFTIIHL